jgi:hypothetical protein
MKTLKHSKFKNTGVLFEALIRQITSDTLNNKDSNAIPILKKYFAKTTELAKELNLYQTLTKERTLKEDKVNQLIDAVRTTHSTLNKKKLAQQKYNLVKDIKEHYVLEHFFNAKINNYKVLASIYKIFEYNIADNPLSLLNNKYSLIEHITKSEVKPINELNEMNDFIKQDKDIRLLSYKILVDKFNEKYSSLNEGQKSILRQYTVSEGTEMKNFVNEQVSRLQSSLKRLTPTVEDDIVRIKLKEVFNILETIKSSKTVSDSHILNLLRYHELIKELKNL